MSGRLVHIGSAVVDYVYRIDALPVPGMEKTASCFAQVAGGGFNMMVAAARTGMKVVFGGQLGSGPNGDFLRAAFAAEGIETLTPPSPVMDSGNCVAMISSDAERTFVSWPGAESVLSLAMMAPVSARLVRTGDTAELHLDQPQYGIAAGQAAVCYAGDRVLGGGWIAATARAAQRRAA